MKTLFISSFSHPASGASALHRLIKGLQRIGHECHLLTANKHFGGVLTHKPQPSRGLQGKLDWLAARALRRIVPFYYLPSEAGYIDTIREIAPDVINIHWTHGSFFVPIHLLPQVITTSPVVWTVHDMWPMTGGCFYTYQCAKYNEGCRSCPQGGALRLFPGATALSWQIKRRLYQELGELTLVAPSQWLADLLRESTLFSKARVVHIPYSVDTDELQPVDQAVARQILGIEEESHVIFLLAKGNYRKGEDLFLKALSYYCSSLTPKEEKLTVLVAGGHALEWNVPSLPSDIRILPVGLIQNHRLLALCYSCADIFVLPTRADNLPSSILESLACGTPIVSFRVGGVPEEIDEGETGYLAQAENYEDLALGMYKILHDKQLLRQMRSRCREVALDKFTLHVQARRYEELFKQVIDERVEC